VGDYSKAAEYYDLLYAATKDYAAESAVVAQLIRAAAPAAHRVLDVACGTGKHAEALTDSDGSFRTTAPQRRRDAETHLNGVRLQFAKRRAK